MDLIHCTYCYTRLDGDYGNYYIVGASEFPACSYECLIALPGLQNGVAKMIDGKKRPLDEDNKLESGLILAIKLLK